MAHKKRIKITIQWNNTCCKCRCPISGALFRPFFGMYPFFDDSYDPISIDDISEINPYESEKIMNIINRYNQLYEKNHIKILPDNVIIYIKL